MSRDGLRFASLHAGFAAVAMVYLFVFAYSTVQFRRHLTEHFKYVSANTANQVANAVSYQLERRYAALKFLRTVFFNNQSGKLLPDAAVQAAFADYQRAHPDIFGINIQNPTGNAIIWSSRRQPSRPITPAGEFVSLPAHPDQLLGRVTYAARARGWVLTMRQRIRDNRGQVLGFIGSPFRLSALRRIHTAPDLQVRLFGRSGRMASVWTGGGWAPPDTSLPAAAGSVFRAVPGFPWSVRAGWSGAAFARAFRAGMEQRAAFLAVALLLLLAGDVAVAWLYGQAVRLRRYQAAAVRIMQDLQSQHRERDIFQRVVDLVVTETGACGAFIAIPDERDSWLRPIAAAAESEALRTAMLALRPSSDPERQPEGRMAASRAFHEGRPIGPFDPQANPMLKAVQAADPVLTRVRAVMAWPIFIAGESRPNAVLVVEETAVGHFSEAVRRLLEQVALSIGIALTDLVRKREIARELAFNEKLFNAVGAVALVINDKGEIERMNEAAERFMGYDMDDVRGRPYFWTRFIPEDERPRVSGVFEAMRSRTIPRDVENHWVSRSGVKRLFRWVNTILDDDKGDPAHVIALGMDVTDQRTMEAALRDSSARLQRLSDFNALLGQINLEIAVANDEMALLQKICALAVRYAHVELAVIAVPGPDNRFTFPAAAGDVSYLDGVAISTDPALPEGCGPSGAAWRTAKAVFVDDFDTYPPLSPWRERYRAHGFNATASLPIFRNGEMWAVFSIYHADANVFDRDLHVLLEELSQNITRGLEAIESRGLETALFHNTAVMTILAKDRVIQRANARGAEMLGWLPEELAGQPTSILYADGEEWRRVGEAYAGIESCGRVRVASVRMRHKDGGIRIGDFSGLPLEGRDGWTVWTIEDVTVRENLSDFNTLLAHVNQEVSAAIDEAAFLRRICDLAVRYGHVELAAIARPDRDGWFDFVTAAGKTAYLAGLRISTDSAIPEGLGVTGTVWREKRALFRGDLMANPATAPWLDRLREHGFVSNASLPIFRHGEIWGVVSFYHSQRDVFDHALRALLEELALDISRGLEMIESRNLRDALFNNSAVMTLLVKGRTIEQVNGRGAEMLGRHPAEMRGLPIRILCADNEEWRRVERAYGEIDAKGETLVVSVQMRRRDSGIVIGDFHVTALAGQPDWTVWTVEDVTRRHQLNQELSRQALFDRLTGLPNRRALDSEFDKAVARANRSGKVLAVVMMDLDGFKPVNDTHGHDIGDAVLRAVGQRFQNTLRRTDFVARLGGDEFVLLVEDCDGLDEVAAVLNKVEAAIAAPIPLLETLTVKVEVSAGLCLYPETDTDNPEALLRYADQALYASKALKGQRRRFWMRYGEDAPRRETAAQALLLGSGLRIFYQPILDTGKGAIVGVEALARLEDGSGRIISPAEFVPGLAIDDLFDLSCRVLRQALTDLEKLDEAGYRLWVSINLDPRNVSDRCVARLQEIIGGTTIAPERIYLEILEGSAFDHHFRTLEHLDALKKEGVRLAIDDVGSAYSSLLRLKTLPVDKIKLDQGFVRTLEQRAEDLHFVAAILDLAEGLGVELVVEGVESEDIFDALCVMGVPALQGYEIGRPMPFAELVAFVGRPPPAIHRRPKSLLGVYARHLVNHNSLKRVALLTPRLLSRTLSETGHCMVEEDLRDMGLAGDHPLFALHTAYHAAIDRVRDEAMAGTETVTLDDLILAENAFLNAIMDTYREKTVLKGDARQIEGIY